jgi:hypothetical protein
MEVCEHGVDDLEFKAWKDEEISSPLKGRNVLCTICSCCGLERSHTGCAHRNYSATSLLDLD